MTSGCSHGFVVHGYIHEAAHAVAAVERGIGFSSVRLLPPDEWHESADGVIAGGIYLTGDIREIGRSSPKVAYEFLMAGVQGERAILGDWVDRGYIGDVNIWRRAVGLTGDQQVPAMEAILGGPLTVVTEDVRVWAVSRKTPILAVAARLETNGGSLTRIEVDEVLAQEGF